MKGLLVMARRAVVKVPLLLSQLSVTCYIPGITTWNHFQELSVCKLLINLLLSFLVMDFDLPENFVAVLLQFLLCFHYFGSNFRA